MATRGTAALAWIPSATNAIVPDISPETARRKLTDVTVATGLDTSLETASKTQMRAPVITAVNLVTLPENAHSRENLVGVVATNLMCHVTSVMGRDTWLGTAPPMTSSATIAMSLVTLAESAPTVPKIDEFQIFLTVPSQI